MIVGGYLAYPSVPERSCSASCLLDWWPISATALNCCRLNLHDAMEGTHWREHHIAFCGRCACEPQVVAHASFVVVRYEPCTASCRSASARIGADHLQLADRCTAVRVCCSRFLQGAFHVVKFTRATLYSLLWHLGTAVCVCRYCFLPGGLHENDFVLAAKINEVPAEDLMRKPKAKPAEASAAAAPSV